MRSQPGQYYIIKVSGTDADVIGIEQPTAKVHWITPNGTLVLKVPGHPYWVSRGKPQGYAGAEFQVYQIQSVLDRGEQWYRVKASRTLTLPIRNEESTDHVDLVLRSF